VRGDATADGEINITDAVSTLGYLFLGGTEPDCLEAADADDSGDLLLTDAIYLLGYLFLGGEQPPAPFGECAEDPNLGEGLGCESFAPCDYAAPTLAELAPPVEEDSSEDPIHWFDFGNIDNNFHNGWPGGYDWGI
jgi:hypothetical protein